MWRRQKKAAQIALADQRRAGVGQAVRVARGRWPVMPKHGRIDQRWPADAIHGHSGR